MHRINFPEWREVLGQSEVPERVRRSYDITIRWYLSFCRRPRAEVMYRAIGQGFYRVRGPGEESSDLGVGRMEGRVAVVEQSVHRVSP